MKIGQLIFHLPAEKKQKIRKIEKINKKIASVKSSLVSNRTCIKVYKYIYIYIHIYIHFFCHLAQLRRIFLAIKWRRIFIVVVYVSLSVSDKGPYKCTRQVEVHKDCKIRSHRL